jgi:hypothetical protein
MGADRAEWMTVEDFLALDRENLDQKKVILPTPSTGSGTRERARG